MQELRITTLAMLGLSLGLGLCLTGPAEAHDGHEHGAPLHGGKVTMTKEYHFEVVFVKDGLKVYPRTHEDKPVDASRLTGTATFYHPNSPKPWFERKLAASSAGRGQAVSFIGSTIDLSKLQATGAKVEFRVEGLPEAAEPTATFTVPFAFTNSGELTIARATQADQASINTQKVCKVSGQDLGSMGVPIKVSRGDRSVFLCCQGCLKTLKANADKYLGTLTAPGAPPVKDEHHEHEN
jgi:hypothetical protein